MSCSSFMWDRKMEMEPSIRKVVVDARHKAISYSIEDQGMNSALVFTKDKCLSKITCLTPHSSQVIKWTTNNLEMSDSPLLPLVPRSWDYHVHDRTHFHLSCMKRRWRKRYVSYTCIVVINFHLFWKKRSYSPLYFTLKKAKNIKRRGKSYKAHIAHWLSAIFFLNKIK